MIAEFLGDGKSVLFVSEKMAALDVVRRRLEEIGLGDALLELHGNRYSKAEIISMLGRTSRVEPLARAIDDEQRRLADLRTRLNSYVVSLH